MLRALRTESDYNRGLAGPVRWARLAWAGVTAPVRPLWHWAGRGARRCWARPLLLGLLAIIVLWPIDGWLLWTLSGWKERLPGDIERELRTIQQFGQGGSIVLVVLLVLSLDRAGAGRLWDWLASIGLAAAVVYPAKMLLGRPRPGLGRADGAALWEGMYAPDVFLGPLGVHPFEDPTGLRHAWEFWAGISADLWSMPSAHTAYAVVMAVFLGAAYPRIRWLVVILACLVGLGRVLFGAHYPTDVAAGAAIGAAAGMSGIHLRLGRRWIARLRARGDAGPDGATMAVASAV